MRLLVSYCKLSKNYCDGLSAIYLNCSNKLQLTTQTIDLTLVKPEGKRGVAIAASLIVFKIKRFKV